MLLRLVVELVQELRKHHAGEPKRLQLLAGRAADPGASAEEQRVEIVPRDLRMKDKFLKHLTGPLSFGPKCSKHFHRLYHNTRDCTVPALNNPIPSDLKSEAKKAAKILREFTEITSRNGPDKIIPAHVIAKAKGLAILSVIKAGFLVTARGGSGIVLARLPDGTWSAPSAIGIAGLGGGFEVGVEADLPLVYQEEVLLQAFFHTCLAFSTHDCKLWYQWKKVSDLVIILNYDRAVEAFAKGGNLTLGGNFTVAVGPLGRFYGQDVRAYDILFGDIPRPAQAEDLYEILDSFTEKYESEEGQSNVRRAAQEQKPPMRELPPKPPRPQQLPAAAPPNSDSKSSSSPLAEVTALYSFEGQQPGDLNFQAGERITVTSKTESRFDWWEGKLRGQTGIFPANYVAMD
ncbi:SH3 domain-containing YSC84-like protein 1 [Tupaia chinensis]|uniref:SH3 domain-containing YSC84-like protein 1 n=1 Tax=Tupaia chinensis TaxID=246437 RepID=L9KMI1_TUPCH|nr:SH3 domain-containing YSC84-like protein 1 [Tupaia chinensis]